MRKITRAAVEAFLHGNEFSYANTTVVVEPITPLGPDYVVLRLHGNAIARYPAESSTQDHFECFKLLEVSDGGGYQTRTTKERLNGIPDVSVHQKKGQWYLNGYAWDGSWAFVGKVIAVRKDYRQWNVEYPPLLGREPAVFAMEEPARLFAQVEAANLGLTVVETSV